MPKLRANGLNFHYWQSGQGPDLVMIHGLGGNLAGWHLEMVPELQGEYRVTTYDLRGHGRSDAPAAGYRTREMAEDLCQIMDVLGIDSAHLVGHSWGVDIALHFALLHPERVRDLVLIEGALLATLADVYRRRDWEGWSYVSETIETLSGEPIPEEKRYDLEHLLQQLVLIPTLYGPSAGRPRDGALVSRVADVLRPIWEGMEQGGQLSADYVARINHRAILIYEANSVFFRAFELLRDRLPRCTTEILPAGKLRHFSGLEHPGRTIELTKDFLADDRATWSTG
jgi:pimeloyl-ACP methyl ester carboxylesterase